MTLPRLRKSTALIDYLKGHHQKWALRFLVFVLIILATVFNLERDETARSATTKIDPSAILAEMKSRSSSISTGDPFDDEASDRNARAVKEQRAQLETLCLHSDNSHYVQGLEAIFQPNESPVIPQNTAIQPCRRVFWDLGVNIGDTVYKFIHAGFHNLHCPSCFHLEKGYMVESYSSAIDPPQRQSLFQRLIKRAREGQWEGIHDWADSRMREATHRTRPEDYCYFGVEGNPAFTEPLQRLASRTMQTTPRPVRSLAFYTDTVITDRDGPVELFVEGGAALGSSILAEKSKRSKYEGKKVAVRGISLATLLKETVVMTGDEESHLIIKMDVEGAEYAILNHDWQTLCRAVEENNLHVSLLLELHGRGKIGRNNDLTAFYRDKIIQKLAKCGVHIVMDSMLLPGWGRVYRRVTK